MIRSIDERISPAREGVTIYNKVACEATHSPGWLRAVATLVAMALSGTSAAEPIGPIGPEIERMLETSPRVLAAVQELEAARYDVGAAETAFLPALSFRADIGPERQDTPTSRRITGDSSGSDLTRKTADLTVSQLLYDGSHTSANLAAARIIERLASLNLQLTMQNLLFDAASAYLNVLRQVELLALAKGNMDVIQIQMGLEDARVARGSGIAVDALLGKARLQLATERVVVFEGALAEARTHYLQVFGWSPNVTLMARPKLPEELVPDTLDEVVSATLEQNLALAIAADEVLVASQNRRMAAANRRPRVDLMAGYHIEEDLASVRGRGDSYSLLLTLSWDFFSGFSNPSRVSAAAARHEQLKMTARDVRRRVTEEATLAFESLHTKRRRVEMLTNASTIAEEVFEARARLREAGTETALNVLDARSEMFRTRIALAQATFDSEVALIKLLLSSGLLDTEGLGAAMPSFLAEHMQ